MCEWCGQTHGARELCQARPSIRVGRRFFLGSLAALVYGATQVPALEPTIFVPRLQTCAPQVGMRVALAWEAAVGKAPDDAIFPSYFLQQVLKEIGDRGERPTGRGRRLLRGRA